MVHTSHNWFLCDPNDLIPAKYKGKNNLLTNDLKSLQLKKDIIILV